MGHQRWLLGGLAGTGVATAHALAYFLIAPDPHAREHLLHTTGHTYFSICAALSVGFLVAGLVGGVASRLRSQPVPRVRFVAAVVALVGLQVGGYLMLEAGERMVIGDSPTSIAGEPAVLLGAVLQIVVGFIAAGLLVLLSAAVGAIGRRLQGTESRRARVGIRLRPDPLMGPRMAVATGGGSLRGPPANSPLESVAGLLRSRPYPE